MDMRVWPLAQDCHSVVSHYEAKGYSFPRGTSIFSRSNIALLHQGIDTGLLSSRTTSLHSSPIVSVILLVLECMSRFSYSDGGFSTL